MSKRTKPKKKMTHDNKGHFSIRSAYSDEDIGKAILNAEMTINDVSPLDVNHNGDRSSLSD